MPCSFVVKNGSKMCGRTSSGMPGAGVAHRQQHVANRSASPERRAASSSVTMPAGRRDLELAALGHRVPRVRAQVHQHLLDLARIGAHLPERRARARSRARPASPTSLTQQRLEARDDLVEVDDTRLQHLLAAEREQLPRERGGALRRSPDLPHVAARQIVGRQLFEQQIGVAEDGRQHVVEVVGDAAGEPTDGFHLVRLPQALLAVARNCSSASLRCVTSRWLATTARTARLSRRLTRPLRRTATSRL